ncbi:MAG: PD-(D/E)XK nuclease family protein [Treponema sp.]|jgi:hypothetical protein|nr:PD-(D/E)XK nuclease family protein [Treponema sp.]
MNIVETILLKNADRPEALFVFPTDVAASRWADHLLRLRGGTVAMNRFIAWDTFKQDSIRSRKQDRRSVPSVLRTIFVSRLIRENAELCGAGKPPVFSSLIRTEWAGQAASFSSWLSGLLPQLGSWFTKTTGLGAALAGGKEAAKAAELFEGDDRDLFILARRYAQFLDAHGLFEPAWETPPFDDTGKECFIFFPESLSDYSEYRELLEGSGRVKPVRAADDSAEERPRDVFFYTNSRSEIAEAALYITALHERERVPWDSIVVSFPGAESYEPYVLREFANRNIPFVRRTGKPLASYPAGRFFRAVSDCASRDFAFAALTSLVLNRHLPWKDGAEIQKLIDFGIKNNCISSWVEEEDGKEKPVNAWEDAFAKPFGGIDPVVRRFFEDLRRRVKALRGAVSFADLRKHYFSFRERFFDMDRCLAETDIVLSRCVSELMYLAEIEKSFPDVPAPDPFMFFVEYLGKTSYLPQQPASGVVILPYRTAAPAPFVCHIVLGASQDNLSAVFSRLGFLPRGKREQLNLADEDASAAFINLHTYNSQRPAAFFCPEHSFSGYAIPHSRLGAALKPRRRYGDDPEFQEKFSVDLYRAESVFYQFLQGAQTGDSDAPVFPRLLHENQKRGFEAWRSRRQGQGRDGKWTANEALRELIRERFCGNSRFPGKAGVSASSLAPYFNCSLQWLFERVLSLENVQIEANLMAENIAGLVYHAALNLFFSELKKNGHVLAAPVYSGEGRREFPALPDSYRELLERSVNEVFAGFPCLPPDHKPVMSALTARLLLAEQKHFHSRLEQCLAAFLSYFAGYRVIGSETSYQAERDSFFLNGIVDCILEDAREDSTHRGNALIVDFKLRYLPDLADCTGDSEKGLANFQLPLYLSLAEENANRPVHTALFFSIVDAKPQALFGAIQNERTKAWLPAKESERIMREGDVFQQIMNEFEEKTEQFAKEISAGEIAVFKPEFEKCNGCNYHRVCRTTYKIDRGYNF